MLFVIWDVLRSIVNFWMDNLLFINFLLSVVIVFFERREPKTVWAWLLVLYFLPILGVFLYFIIGYDFRKKKLFRTKEIEGAIHAAVRTQEETIKSEKFCPSDPKLQKYSDLVLMNLHEASAVYTADNRVQVITDGRKKFRHLYQEIQNAKEYIHIQYYIIKNDELWQALEKELIKKAKAGVEVRVLYDSMGCRAMRKRDWERMRKAGIQVGEFFPALFGRFHFRVNYRNHRKIVVIDGKTAFVGGFNVGREYVSLNEKMGYWRDTHLKISGSAVLALHIRFILDWNYATKQNLFEEDKYFKDHFKKPAGEEAIQIITSGPDSKEQNIRNTYLKMISKARKTIYVQTPYFVPDESVLDALKIAALSGVDVRIMIPCKPDHPLVYWATYSYIGELVSVGAKCYTYNNGFLHAKGMTVDGVVSCYGTANMDIRSFKLNFEVNAVVYSSATTGELDRLFLEDLKYCTLITPQLYEERSFVVRVKEQFSRLFSPLL